MVLATRRSGQCLFCTPGSTRLRCIGPTRINGNRWFSSGHVRFGILEDLLSSKLNTLPYSPNGAKDLELNLRNKTRRGRLKAINEWPVLQSYALPNREVKIQSLRNEEIRSPVLRRLTSRSGGIPQSNLLRSMPRQDPSQIALVNIHSIAVDNFGTLRRKFLKEYYHQNSVDGFMGIRTEKEFHKIADDFAAALRRSYDAASRKKQPTPRGAPRAQDKPQIFSAMTDSRGNVSDEASLFHELRQVFIIDRNDLPMRIKYLFTKYICDAKISTESLNHQKKVPDLRYPTEWFPATRALQRKIHLHVGPTNSGKTFQALQRLEQAKSGVYAGPLRLLAHEVYSRLNAKGKPCSLITGEERRHPEGSKKHVMSSCTVEMVPLNIDVEVAVIDEIQMIADEHRGWAWTQAFLGVKAKEVHLCGELRTIPLIENLCKLMGDDLTIHRYERLSPLECMGKSLNGKLDKLKKGDCIILFSRLAIHAMKKEVENVTGKRCAVVYGSLPPETRAQQAALFNDPNNDYDFLVASDAVGMGLNLAIRRIIFEGLAKFDGKTFVNIPVSEVKQIAGRAGRFKTAAEVINPTTDLVDEVPRSPLRGTNIGLATTLDSIDHPLLKKAMDSDVEPLRAAGILPPSTILQRFAAYFPKGTPLSFIILRLKDFVAINPLFFLCDLTDQLMLADLIEPFDMTLQDRLIFISAPASVRRRPLIPIVTALASMITNHGSVDLLEIPEFDLELLNGDSSEGKEYLSRLETLHLGLTLYLWLSYRFAGIFSSQALAFHIKSLVEEKINESLGSISFEERHRRMRQAAKLKAIQNKIETPRSASTIQDATFTPMSYEDENRQEPLLDITDEEGLPDENEDDDERFEAELDIANPNEASEGG